MAGETFASFISEDPNTTALTLPVDDADRIPVVRGTPPGEVTYYVAPHGVAAGPYTATLELTTPAPLNNSQLLHVTHSTGTTPMTGSHIYGGLFQAIQLVPSTSALDDPASYVGLFGTGTARATGGEGGFSTTLAAPAAHLDTTLTLTSTTGFVDGLRMQLVLDNGTVQPVDQVGPPVGNVITLAQTVNSAATAGNVVYIWHGAVKGVGAQSSMTTGATGMLMGSAEFSMSAQTGSQPFIKYMLGLTANFDDDVGAIGPYDHGMFLSAQVGAVGTKSGIAFTPISGRNLVRPDGTLIKAFGGAYSIGIDFSLTAFDDFSLSLPGFTVDGDGLLKLSRPSAQVVYDNTTLTVTTGGLWRETASGGNFSFQVNTAVAGDFSTTLTPLVLFKEGGVAAAPAAKIATNATGAFLFIPTTAGKPTGVPTNAAAGRTAMVYNSTDKQLCLYDQTAGAWYGVILTTPL